jgi:hypothetical protein
LTQIAGQVAIAIDNAFAYRRITELSDQLKQENLYLEDEIRSELNFEDIIGNSAALRQVLRQVEAVAPTNSTVLIQGERSCCEAWNKAPNATVSDAKTRHLPSAEILVHENVTVVDRCQPFGTLPIYKHLRKHLRIDFAIFYAKVSAGECLYVRHADCSHVRQPTDMER